MVLKKFSMDIFWANLRSDEKWEFFKSLECFKNFEKFGKLKKNFEVSQRREKIKKGIL